MPDSLPTTALRRGVLALHTFTVVALPAWAGVIGALAAAPLLVPLPGLWRGRSYTYAWASLLLVFYVGGFLAEAYAQPARRWVALSLAVVSAAEFCLLMLFVRMRAAERRRGLAE